MRDSRKKKLRDLRRIARSSYNPSIYDLFDKYHPEVAKWDSIRYFGTPAWHIYHNLKYGWVTRIAGYWDALGGAPPSWFRRSHNRLRRARQKEALRVAVSDDAWDDFLLPLDRRNIRWEWF